MVDMEEEIIKYKNWTIKLKENNTKNAINIYVENNEDYKFFDTSIEQENLNVNGDFKDKSLQEIKERIVDLLNNKKFELEYDQEKGSMKLTLKLKEDYPITLNENRNQVIYKLFEQMSSLMEIAKPKKQGDKINNIESDDKPKDFQIEK